MAKAVRMIEPVQVTSLFTLKPGEVEVSAIVCGREHAKDIGDHELFTLWTAFHRQLMFIRTKDELRVFSFDDQTENRLIALLPFMPHFRQQRIVVSRRRKQQYALKQGAI